MALPSYSGAPMPSSGLGNIAAGFGSSNAPAAMPPAPMGGAAMAPRTPMMNPGVAPPQGAFGNAAGAMGGPAANAQQAGGGMAGGLAGVFSQMDPAHAAAIRSIPPQAMQALHSAGMIHPQLMQHLYGSQMNRNQY